MRRDSRENEETLWPTKTSGPSETLQAKLRDSIKSGLKTQKRQENTFVKWWVAGRIKLVQFWWWVRGKKVEKRSTAKSAVAMCLCGCGPLSHVEIEYEGKTYSICRTCFRALGQVYFTCTSGDFAVLNKVVQLYRSSQASSKRSRNTTSSAEV